MGLREKHKHTRRGLILSAARTLFLEFGYHETKAESIAEVSEVSLATLYNYFDGKGEILLTLVTQENERIHDHIEQLELPYQYGAEAVLQTVFGCYFAKDLISLNRNLWRIGFALSFSDIKTDGARALRAIDRKMSNQVYDVIKELQAKRLIRMDVDCEVFARTLFNNVNMLFFDYSRAERMTMKDLCRSVDEMSRSMVQLITNSSTEIREVESKSA